VLRRVGVPEATLYRWEKSPEAVQADTGQTWTPALVEAVETLRLDHPMWGRDKIGPLVRREGFAVFNASRDR
jgi:putative transposase